MAKLITPIATADPICPPVNFVAIARQYERASPPIQVPRSFVAASGKLSGD
jgi:hypothetical protein